MGTAVLKVDRVLAAQPASGIFHVAVFFFQPGAVTPNVLEIVKAKVRGAILAGHMEPSNVSQPPVEVAQFPGPAQLGIQVRGRPEIVVPGSSDIVRPQPAQQALPCGRTDRKRRICLFVYDALFRQAVDVGGEDRPHPPVTYRVMTQLICVYNQYVHQILVMSPWKAGSSSGTTSSPPFS